MQQPSHAEGFQPVVVVFMSSRHVESVPVVSEIAVRRGNSQMVMCVHD